MRTLLKTVLILGALLADLPARADSSQAEAKVRSLPAQWEQAWNGHDMKALANLFTEDADFVNVGARHWKGREQIEKEHAARLKQFLESVWSTKDVTVQFLEPDLALVHVAWALTGDKDPDGTPRPPREGLFTWVVVSQGGNWLIRAAQNTNRGNLAPH